MIKILENISESFSSASKTAVVLILGVALVPVGLVQLVGVIIEQRKIKKNILKLIESPNFKLKSFDVDLRPWRVKFSHINGLDFDFSERTLGGAVKYVLPYRYTRADDFKSFLVEGVLSEKEAEDAMAMMVSFIKTLKDEEITWTVMYNEKTPEPLLVYMPYWTVVLVRPISTLNEAWKRLVS